MGTIDNIMINYEDEVYNANQIKEIVLQKLKDDKIIDEKQHQELINKYQIILIKRNWFKRYYNKMYDILKPKNVDSKDKFLIQYQYKLVEFETLENNNNQE